VTDVPPSSIPSRAPIDIGLLDAIRNLHAAGGALLVQALLLGQLARVEWQEEKNRLMAMLFATLFGFACVLCVLLSASGLVLAACWATNYRYLGFTCLIVLYACGAAAAWRRLKAGANLGDQSFAASRKELVADAVLLKASL
jgi:uncharacterized membrane protein YqjE